MPRGGARPGAGRKPKPLADGATALKKQMIGDAEPVISGESPLEFLLNVMQSPDVKLSVRMQAAAIAAPFQHAKPAAIGKKEQRTDNAVNARSKFALPATPPKLAAVGGKKT